MRTKNESIPASGRRQFKPRHDPYTNDLHGNYGPPLPPARVSGRETPLCPDCNARMVLRTARRGYNPGNQFWGCPRYPDCRGTMSLRDD
jgi:hypothetical protein